MGGIPHAGRHRPEQRQGHDQDEAVEPSGKPDLAVFEPEAAALEIGEHGASRPEEFHLRPLTERCGSLSAHTAPTKQPVGIRVGCRTASLPPRSPPVASWTLTTTAWPNPFAPAA